jgi:ADP-ribosyl cyclase
MFASAAPVYLLISVITISPLLAQQWTERQNPYLKEVLMGRCYESPAVQQPEPDALSCSFAVDSFMGVLDSHLDEDIGTSAFDMYLEMTDYSSQKDSSLFIWPPPSSKQTDWVFSTDVTNLVLPETTPGGALVQGLVFCGSDRRLDCPAEYWTVNERGAQSSFWQGVYSNFAAKAQGRVRFVILDEDLNQIPTIWNNLVLPRLTGATFVDVIAADCMAPGVSSLTDTLQAVYKIRCTCTSIFATDWSSGVSVVCQVADILDDMDSAFTPAAVNINKGSQMNSQPARQTQVPTAEATPIECDRECPGSVYMVLFWGLVLFGSAGAYAIWSVWHYLPEYHRIPNVGEEHELSGCPNLPKQ